MFLLIAIAKGGVYHRKSGKKGAISEWVRVDKTLGFCLMSRV